MANQDDLSRRTALRIIEVYPERERAVLLNWAQQVISIRRSDLSAPKKIARIVSVTKELGLSKPLLVHVVKEIKRVGWDERSKPMRGVVGGAGVGLIASVAGPMAGVAAFGGAVAIPVVLLGAGAGAVLMAIVNELDSHD